MYTYEEFFTDVLNRLNAPVTSDSLHAFYAVTTLEGLNSRWNPLNSVVVSGDSTSFNSVGVQDYKTYENGVKGTVALLEGKPWVNVLHDLRTGASTDEILKAFTAVYAGWDKGVHFPRNDDLGSTTMSGPLTSEDIPTQQHHNPISIDKPLDANHYRVVEGDSLWKIATKVYGDGTKYRAIADANNIKSPYVIRPNQILTIPKYPAPHVKPPHRPNSSIRSYQVVKNDTLWNIADKEYGNPELWHRIARANHLKSPYIIVPGQTLVIPAE